MKDSFSSLTGEVLSHEALLNFYSCMFFCTLMREL